MARAKTFEHMGPRCVPKHYGWWRALKIENKIGDSEAQKMHLESWRRKKKGWNLIMNIMKLSSKRDETVGLILLWKNIFIKSSLAFCVSKPILKVEWNFWGLILSISQTLREKWDLK